MRHSLDLVYNFLRRFEWLRSPFIFLLRVYWGYLMYDLGMLKLGMMGDVVESFGEMGILFPFFAAWFTAIGQVVGGLSWMIGLFTRFWGLFFTIMMSVAYYTAHFYVFEFMMEGDFVVFTEELPFPFLFIGLVTLIFGPGKLSLDWLWLGSQLEKK